ncbi:hypothetical protein TgHK011_000189 [Trichoderma gracile]|nr:hypothetical protein TgHK011_000189 [Trichoderma gracile]
MPSPSEQTLLVTGANGFVAQHIINEALTRGFNVRGTVRSESSAAKIRPVFSSHGAKFSVAVVPDLTNKDLYAPAFAESPAPITGVINVAAPLL